MMQKIKSRRLHLAAIALLIGGLTACTTVEGVAGQISSESEEENVINASGFIETDEVSVVSEVSGRVAEVVVDEAETVEAEQIVIVLDETLLEAERIRALAAVTTAKANLRKLKADATEDELAAAQAAVDAAQAGLNGAQWASGQAWTTVNNPLEIDVAIVNAENQAKLAQQRIDILLTQIEQKQFLINVLNDTDQPDEGRIKIEQVQKQTLEAELRAAQAEYDGAQRKLEELQAQRERPLAAIAAAQQASSQIPVAEAQIVLAQAQYDIVISGARTEEIAIVEAQVALAEANVALIDAYIAQLTMMAPIDGVITTRSINVGETAAPGVPLLTISNLETLKLIVYIPEPQIGHVQLNATVDVSVDAYPDETFEGEIVYIASEAEFTPRNVQTEEERVNLVFAVEIKLDNPDGQLKPGMPADVVIEK